MTVKTDPALSTKVHGSDGKDFHIGDAFFEAAAQGGLVLNAQPKASFGGQLEGTTIVPFLTDENGSAEMNIDASFSGTPIVVHDGIDSTAWTASTLDGLWDFDSPDHAKQGIVTVLTYGNLTGAIITIQGTNITDTILTEGIEWAAATSNDATVSSIQSAIDAIEGVSATVSGSVVTVIADNSTTQADMTTLSTGAGGGDMTATAQSIDASLTINGAEALFKAGATVDMSNYTAISLHIMLTKWNSNQNNEISIRARLAGVDVGTLVNLSDQMDTNLLGVWQQIALNKNAFGIDLDTIDEFVFETITTAVAPDYYVDSFQIEEFGASVSYTFEPPPGTQFHFQKEEVLFAATSAIEALDPHKFINLNRLPIGIVSVLTKDGSTAVATALRDNFDALAVGSGSFVDFHANGATIFGKLVYDVGANSDNGAIILRSSAGDKITINVNDNLSGLDNFRIGLVGQLHVEVS